MTEKEKFMYGNVNFYFQMLKNKYDNGILVFVTSKLAEQDRKFTMELIPFFLSGLNNLVDQN
jgi:hypothetical protein